MNEVMLIGRSGGNAELKFAAEGKPAANFSLAVNESFKTRDGERTDHVEWFRLVCWNKLGEIVGQFVTKGKLVYVEAVCRRGNTTIERACSHGGGSRRDAIAAVGVGTGLDVGTRMPSRGMRPVVNREQAAARNKITPWTMRSPFERDRAPG